MQQKDYSLFYIKAGLLLFWACWFAIASSTNIFDFLYTQNLLPANWAFKSNNFSALKQVFAIYDTNFYFLETLFAINTAVQISIAILFFISFFLYIKTRTLSPIINYSFALSMLLWAIFLIMEEIYIAYSFEATHRQLFTFELISLLALYLLPTPQHN